MSAGEPVEVRVSLRLCPGFTVTEACVVGVFVPATEALIVFVNGCVKDLLLVTEPVEEALGVLVCVVDRVVVLLIGGVPVNRIDAVPDTETVDVFELDMDLVMVADAEFVLVARTDCVGVLVSFDDTVVVTLVVDVLELVILRDALGDDVDVLDDVIEGVPVADTRGVFVNLLVFVNDGEAEEVLDEAMVFVSDAHAVGVLDGCDDLVEHTVAEEVFELVEVVDIVFVGAVDRVEVLEAVIVFVGKALAVCNGLDVEVFDTLTVFVDVIEAVVVFVEVVECVFMFVGKDERVSVVVFVDVLD